MSGILGYFAIIFGLIWIIWPETLRGWVVRRASWALFGLLLFPSYFPAVKWAAERGIDWSSVLIGFAVVCFALQFLLSKLAQGVPIELFRAAGVINILLGVYMIWGKSR